MSLEVIFVHIALTGSNFTLTDSVLRNGENSVLIQATGQSGDNADIQYSVLRHTATNNHSPIGNTEASNSENNNFKKDAYLI